MTALLNLLKNNIYKYAFTNDMTEQKNNKTHNADFCENNKREELL